MDRKEMQGRVYHHELTHFIRVELSADELTAGASIKVPSLPCDALVTSIFGYCVTAFNGGDDVFKVETVADDPADVVTLIADGDVAIDADETLTPQKVDVGFYAMDNTALKLTYTATADPTEGAAMCVIEYIPKIL